jgi:hypothetical protein
MDTLTLRIARTALPTTLAFALLLAPLLGRAGDAPTDCHEIPKFVLDRIELPPGADAAARVAAGATAADAARTGATQ